MDFREVSKRMMLPAGRYCIIPSTFEEDQEGEFLLRVLQSREWASLKTEKTTNDGDSVEVEEEVITITLTRKRIKGVQSLEQLYDWDLGGMSEKEILTLMFQ